MPDGPQLYSHWRAEPVSNEQPETLEYPLFSDAYVTGGYDAWWGPFQLVNALPSTNIPFPGTSVEADESRPVALLRIKFSNSSRVSPDMSQTAHSGYTGGAIQQEFGALLSLCTGVRFRAGDFTRMFLHEGDPLGIPRGLDASIPSLGVRRGGRIIPSSAGAHGLEVAERIKGIPQLDSRQATALIIAARSYQDALWIAESEPELAWLLFVSAIETAAKYWDQGQMDSMQAVREWNPPLSNLLETQGEDFALEASGYFSNLIGSTRKFLDFVMQFAPGPPNKRPQLGLVDFGPGELRKSLRKVYQYRSKALHEGTPFPYVMCIAPRVLDESGVVSERPLGLSSSAYGGTWLAEDTPMMLHMFEYITRASLANWWASLVSSNSVT